MYFSQIDFKKKLQKIMLLEEKNCFWLHWIIHMNFDQDCWLNGWSYIHFYMCNYCNQEIMLRKHITILQAILCIFNFQERFCNLEVLKTYFSVRYNIAHLARNAFWKEPRNVSNEKWAIVHIIKGIVISN